MYGSEGCRSSRFRCDGVSRPHPLAHPSRRMRRGRTKRRTVLGFVLGLTASAYLATAAGPDPFGRTPQRAIPARPGRVESSCGACSDPASGMFGVEFRQGELWVLQISGTLYRMSNCHAIETIAIQGFRGAASGLAYDSKRDLFVVTDAVLDQIDQVRLAGKAEGLIVHSWPSPSSGPVGVAYDSTRDIYWITDFEARMIQSFDPNTGLPGVAFSPAAGSNLGGTAYDAVHDMILYNGRFQGTTYMISAATGALLDSLPIPGGDINSEDIGLAPDGAMWIHQTNLQRVVCVDRSTSVTPKTWGQLKALYR